eukprot:878111-Prymnesium_polylepis.1
MSEIHQLCSGKLGGELENSGSTPPDTPPRGAHTAVTQTRSCKAGIAPHAGATATALPARASRAVNRAKEDDVLRSHPEAQRASKVGSRTALVRSTTA